MGNKKLSDDAKAVVRRNTEEVQSRGNFDLFEELFADDFVYHTPQPNTTPDKDGVRKLYHVYGMPFLIFMQIFIGRPLTATW
jgi:hypothetical protein